ncbi:hypothetical protein [Pedobacter soli]|uniref:Uncharacterized protein n=1 Tax=Pedobacter soli TaxID=390242 RepID=A0A1G6UAW3_9SPHI|nr:hypothetical protein [Pedobacter soli]SDD38399.1 hypothetical protein SAMN04488024_105291 [Pedobacter soli]
MFRLMLALSMFLGTVFGYFTDQKSVAPVNNKTDCPHKKDLLTGKVIYSSYDEPATNEGRPD